MLLLHKVEINEKFAIMIDDIVEFPRYQEMSFFLITNIRPSFFLVLN